MDNQTPIQGEVIAPSPKIEEPILLVEDNIAQEEKELQALFKKYNMTPKMIRWMELFTDKENKYALKTFGNQTQSAIHAYNLDPVKQYDIGSSMGYQNFRKLQFVVAKYAEKQGWDYGKMVDVAMNKMTNSNNPEWYYIVAQLTGFPITPVKGNIQMTQNNLNMMANGEQGSQTPKQIEEKKEEVEKFNRSFQKFLEAGEPE